MRCISRAVLILGCSIGLGCAGYDEMHAMKMLNGTWDVVAEDVGNGEKRLKHGMLFMGIDGKSIGFGSLPGGGAPIGELDRVDMATKPARIDIKRRDGGETLLGIFELSGDKLKLLIRAGVKDHPTEFKGSPGAPVMVLERRKK